MNDGDWLILVLYGGAFVLAPLAMAAHLAWTLLSEWLWIRRCEAYKHEHGGYSLGE